MNDVYRLQTVKFFSPGTSYTVNKNITLAPWYSITKRKKMVQKNPCF
jgi:hypothetical protein